MDRRRTTAVGGGCFTLAAGLVGDNELRIRCWGAASEVKTTGTLVAFSGERTFFPAILSFGVSCDLRELGHDCG